MSLHYSMKPPERTISNSSFIMSATTPRRLLSKRSQNFSKICGGRTPWEGFWWAAKPSADLRPAKEEPFSPAQPLRFALFASAKAALRAVAQGLAREFGPQGIHVAHIVIDGAIQGEYAATKFADYVRSKGENGLLSVEAIAEAYLALHRQPASAWTHELDLRPFKEPF
jgi:NAD(P)-dependent dehydrogenase (short-subunit alcohol dehydrogenase family)